MEMLIVCVAGIILLVILGIRYVSEPTPGSSGVSSTLLTLLFLLVVGATLGIEVVFRVLERRRVSGSGKGVFFGAVVHWTMVPFGIEEKRF